MWIITIDLEEHCLYAVDAYRPVYASYVGVLKMITTRSGGFALTDGDGTIGVEDSLYFYGGKLWFTEFKPCGHICGHLQTVCCSCADIKRLSCEICEKRKW